MRKEKETKKELKKTEKNQTIWQGSYPFSEKNFKFFFQAQIYFSRACSLFLPGLSGSGKCQNKIAGLSRFSRPFRALSDKMSIMKLVNFSPFLESFFPGGGGRNKVTKIPNWYSNDIFRLSVSKTLPKLPAFFAPLRLDRSLTASTRKPKAVRWWFQILDTLYFFLFFYFLFFSFLPSFFASAR